MQVVSTYKTKIKDSHGSLEDTSVFTVKQLTFLLVFL